MCFSLKWRIREEKTRDVSQNGGFAKRKRVIFGLNGGFAEQTRDFRVTWGICEEKTRDFRLNGGCSLRKHVIFT